MCACLYLPFAQLFSPKPGQLGDPDDSDAASLPHQPAHTEGLSTEDLNITTNTTPAELASSMLSPTNAAPARRGWRGAGAAALATARPAPEPTHSLPAPSLTAPLLTAPPLTVATASRSDSADRRVETALQERLLGDARAALLKKCEVTQRTRYKCTKGGRHGSKSTRWLAFELSERDGEPTELVVYKESPGHEKSENTRFSKLGNLRPRLVDGTQIVVDFHDHSCSSVVIHGINGGGGERVILPPKANARGRLETQTMDASVDEAAGLPTTSLAYLEDLMFLLTQGFYHPHTGPLSSAPDSKKSQRENRRGSSPNVHPAEEILSDLELTVADALFIAMQNYGERNSSDGTIWEEVMSRHVGLDGTRVWKSQSYNPSLPRFKCVAHIYAKPDQCWEAYVNPVVRPGWDKKIFRFNILREWPLPDADSYKGKAVIQLLHYSTDPKSTGALAGREFFEVRVLMPAKDEDDTAKIITIQIRGDQEEKYRQHAHVHQTSLGAKNHEHCLFFKPFKNGTMTRMTSVSKLELTGSIFRGTFSALNYDKVAEYVGKMTMYLKKGLETEGQLYLPDWEEKMAQREPSIEAKGRSPSSPRAPGKGIAQFECTVEKGPPGVGFGLIVEEIGMGQITVMQVIENCIKYHSRGKGERGEQLEVKEGDVIVQCMGIDMENGIQDLVGCLRRVKIYGGVDMIIERGLSSAIVSAEANPKGMKRMQSTSL